MNFSQWRKVVERKVIKRNEVNINIIESVKVCHDLYSLLF